MLGGECLEGVDDGANSPNRFLLVEPEMGATLLLVLAGLSGLAFKSLRLGAAEVAVTGEVRGEVAVGGEVDVELGVNALL